MPQTSVFRGPGGKNGAALSLPPTRTTFFPPHCHVPHFGVYHQATGVLSMSGFFSGLSVLWQGKPSALPQEAERRIARLREAASRELRERQEFAMSTKSNPALTEGEMASVRKLRAAADRAIEERRLAGDFLMVEISGASRAARSAYSEFSRLATPELVLRLTDALLTREGGQ